ncbi:hypothetical protein M427DRAFT_51984 [Gonapodya prolifera JEL478]|uniref:Uncharacterized protein n=1 Tax=Gonapodya prolifera (strain JEL478) TaxID=1344416 RepID=A0A139AWD6_GONPJ|nr:hypothetical protein M427DRAFT_51984 [Gonapodya prolifera JEL478]|eukprot:KXS21052.1 hypothetical protein M427DRAFT_51984 [Gonapodya prolifera JEL478]
MESSWNSALSHTVKVVFEFPDAKEILHKAWKDNYAVVTDRVYDAGILVACTVVCNMAQHRDPGAKVRSCPSGKTLKWRWTKPKSTIPEHPEGSGDAAKLPKFQSNSFKEHAFICSGGKVRLWEKGDVPKKFRAKDNHEQQQDTNVDGHSNKRPYRKTRTTATMSSRDLPDEPLSVPTSFDDVLPPAATILYDAAAPPDPLSERTVNNLPEAFVALSTHVYGEWAIKGALGNPPPHLRSKFEKQIIDPMTPQPMSADAEQTLRDVMKALNRVMKAKKGNAAGTYRSHGISAASSSSH